MKTNKGFIVPLLLGVIALLVIGGGFYIYQNKKAEAPVVVGTNIEQSTQIQQEPKTESSSIDISNWKTYTNSKYGFEFQYPGDRIYKEIIGKDSQGVSYFDVDVNTKENIEFTCDGCDGPITFFRVSSYKQNGDSVANCSRNYQFEVLKVKVGEILADKCVSDGLNGPLLLIDIPRNGVDSQHVSAQNYEGGQKLLVDKILSTFKFTVPITNSQSSIYENQYMKVIVPAGWIAKQAVKKVYYNSNTPTTELNPAAVNITKGNYILYINTQASQASGVEGGRFSEIATGAPSAEAVITEWPSECGTPETHTTLLTNHPRVDLYVGPQDKQPWCNIPINGKTAWFFSYITDSSWISPLGHSGNRPYFNYYQNPSENGVAGYVITMAYNSKDINSLPLKGSVSLNTALSEMTSIINTLQIKQQ